MSPNILFLHGHNSGRFIQPYGHGVPTPNLMWLARQGVLFRQAFAAAPSCSPSRASFLTGRHPHCCGMLDYCVPPRPFSDTAALREMTAGYKRSAREMDDCFGVILETLAETGLDRKTYVFAFTDHGLQWPLHIANVGEHGNATFLIARGPEHFTGGGVLDAMISLMDLFPTVCDLAGLEQPSWLQGQSLLSLTSGEVSALHDKLFFEQTYHAAYEPMRAVRTERHIYIKRFDDRDQLVLPNTDQTPAKGDLLAAGWKDQPRHQEMLYDLYFDPDQQNNLIGEPGTDEIVSELRRALAAWMEETDDPLCEGPVPLPKDTKTTNPDAFAPNEQPWIIGE